MAGGDASQVPAALDPSWINRKFEAIEQWQREMMPSVARTVTDIVGSLVTPAIVSAVHPAAFVIPDSAFPGTAIITTTVTIPPNRTRAKFMLNAMIQSYNTTPATWSFAMNLRVNGSLVGWGGQDVPYTAPGAYITSFRMASGSLSGLVPGESVTVEVLAYGAGYAWTSTADNAAMVTGVVIFDV